MIDERQLSWMDEFLERLSVTDEDKADTTLICQDYRRLLRVARAAERHRLVCEAVTPDLVEALAEVIPPKHRI